jgi:TRAP-type transport system periplasmic protein
MLGKGKLFKTFGAAAAVAIIASVAQAQEIKLSAINYLPHAVDYGAVFMSWVDDVNKEGAGKVKIEVRAFGSIPVINMANAVRSGVVDIANVPPAFYQTLLPWADGIKLSTISHAEMHRNGAEAFINAGHNEKVGVEYLTTYGDGDQFVLYLREKAIKKPEDLKGLKIRITPIYRALFTAFGAEVVTIPVAELPTTLERGVVDGYGWTTLSIRDNGFAKYTKYRIEPGFYTPNNAILVNLAKWRSLPKEVQDFLKRKAIQLATEYPTRYGSAAGARARQQVIEDGVKIITFEPNDAKRWVETAHRAAWEEIDRIDPVNGPKLRKLITK